MIRRFCSYKNKDIYIKENLYQSCGFHKPLAAISFTYSEKSFGFRPKASSTPWLVEAFLPSSTSVKR